MARSAGDGGSSDYQRAWMPSESDRDDMGGKRDGGGAACLRVERGILQWVFLSIRKYGRPQMGPSGSQPYKMASFSYTDNCNGMFPISRIVMAYFQSVIFAMVWFQLTRLETPQARKKNR